MLAYLANPLLSGHRGIPIVPEHPHYWSPEQTEFQVRVTTDWAMSKEFMEIMLSMMPDRCQLVDTAGQLGVEGTMVGATSAGTAA